MKKRRFIIAFLIFILLASLLPQNSYASFGAWWDSVWKPEVVKDEWDRIQKEYNDACKNDNERKKFMTEMSDEKREEWLRIAEAYAYVASSEAAKANNANPALG